MKLLPLLLLLALPSPARGFVHVEDPRAILPVTDKFFAGVAFEDAVRLGDHTDGQSTHCEIHCNANQGSCRQLCEPASDRMVTVTACEKDEATLATQTDLYPPVETKLTRAMFDASLGNPLRLFLNHGFGVQSLDNQGWVQIWGATFTKFTYADGREFPAIRVELSLIGYDPNTQQSIEMPMRVTIAKGLPLVGQLAEVYYFPNFGPTPAVRVGTVTRARHPFGEARRFKVGSSLSYASVSPDGSTIAVLAGMNKRIDLWDVASGTAGPQLASSAPVQSLHWSTDSSQVAAASQIWDQVPLVRHWIYESWTASSGAKSYSIAGYPRGVATVLDAPADPSHGLIALVYGDSLDTVTLESLDDAGATTSFVLLYGNIARARFSADRSRLVTLSDGGAASVWRMPSGLLEAVLPVVPGARAADWSADGSRLAVSGAAQALVWDVASRRTVAMIAGTAESPVLFTQLSADGSRALVGRGSKEVELHELEAGGEDARIPVEAMPVAAAFLADGSVLVADQAGTVSVSRP